MYFQLAGIDAAQTTPPRQPRLFARIDRICTRAPTYKSSINPTALKTIHCNQKPAGTAVHIRHRLGNVSRSTLAIVRLKTTRPGHTDFAELAVGREQRYGAVVAGGARSRFRSTNTQPVSRRRSIRIGYT